MEGNHGIEPDQQVLFVGLVCVDILNHMEKYPIEDQAHRCLDCVWQRGGNASNSSTVISLLGGSVEFFGTLSDSKERSFIEEDFKKYKVEFERCVVVPNTLCPISVVILNKETSSRTVLHTNKNLPELKLSHLQDKIDLCSGLVGWIHFEGRDNAEEMAKMLKYIDQQNEQLISSSSSRKRIITSLEAEKLRLAPRLVEFDMWRLPDVMFVSKDFARTLGYTDMESAAQGLYERLKPGAVLICAWGEQGAAAMSAQSGLVTSAAFPPDGIVDTCGAGDTFNAATIHALSKGKDVKDSITFGCKVAGFKCGIQGYENIKDFRNTL
ncbi:ketohexokinase [Aplysia californica]|uniref:Ketohexokinase n=1 Tax=Aplysia californica TaxID=6500 RepID=A0ABM0JFC8_APLCA|nr:ketohexokinase [Aplysia californica]